MRCPHCSLENPAGAVKCDCGWDFRQSDGKCLPGNEKLLAQGIREDRSALKWTLGLVLIAVGLCGISSLCFLLISNYPIHPVGTDMDSARIKYLWEIYDVGRKDGILALVRHDFLGSDLEHSGLLRGWPLILLLYLPSAVPLIILHKRRQLQLVVLSILFLLTCADLLIFASWGWGRYGNNWSEVDLLAYLLRLALAFATVIASIIFLAISPLDPKRLHYS